jgi:hypothetical protein
MRDAVHAMALCKFSQYLVAGIPFSPLLVSQGTADDSVTPDMAQRLAADYRAAGGGADLETFETQSDTFTTKDPNTPASQRAVALIPCSCPMLPRQGGR